MLLLICLIQCPILADTVKEDSLKTKYNIDELYWLVQAATAFLVQDGFEFKESNGPIKNPTDPGDAAYLVSIALAEHGNNESKVAYSKKSNITNVVDGVVTDDWGLWQINDGKEILEYLTSTSPHTNSNISIFKNKSRAEFKKMMMNPFYNAIAAVALAQLQSDDSGINFSEEYQGVNNWSTVKQKKIMTLEPLQQVSSIVGKMDVQQQMTDKHLEYWDEIFQTDIKNIKPADEITLEPKVVEQEPVDYMSNMVDLLNKANQKRQAKRNENVTTEPIFKNIMEGGNYGTT